MSDFGQIVKGLRLTFETGRSKDVQFRRTQLKNLARMYEENADDLVKALYKDLRKPEFEGYMYEVLLLLRDVKSALRNLSAWTKPKKIAKNLISLLDNASYDYQPHGVVLIIGPWNYPMHLTLMPFAGAIAAGNCVLIKPSEVSSHCSATIAALIPKYLDQECYKIVQGDANETQKLLNEKFNFIFFTGSSQIGKIIYSQAALTLTPVCLELGGKSPVYIDNTADIRMAAQRIMWAKCVCLGQTCISPDFILCTKDVENQFIHEARLALKEFYGENIQGNKDLSRIINTKNFSRVRRLLTETRGEVALGGKLDEYDLFIEPTILVGVDEHEPSMTEEIFGPLLPIFPVRNAKDAIDFINNRPNPLALYIFSKQQKVIKMFLERTNSGGVCVNDALYHTSVAEIPFGGIGESGLGQYHGKFSFKTFSRPRSVVQRSFSSFENKINYAIRYPPYTKLKYKLLKFGLSNFSLFYIRTGFIPYLFCFLIGLLVMYGFQLLSENCALDNTTVQI